MVTPAKRNITMYRNADYYESYTFGSADNPLDLTGFSFKMAMRKAHSSDSSIECEIEDSGTPFVDGIYVDDPSSGVISIFISQETLAGLSSNPITTADEFSDITYDFYYYDLKVTDDDGVQQLYIRGVASVYSGITE